MFATIEENFGKNKPIFLSDMIEVYGCSRARVNQLVSEYVKKGQLARYSDGVFYIPTTTILGRSTLDVKKVIARKYIKNGTEVFGIYSGLSLMNSFGFTNQVPSVYEIVTNNECTRVREVNLEGQKLLLRRARFAITNENYKIYTLLEVLNKIGINEKFDNATMLDYVKINKIKFRDIAKYIDYFPAKVSKNLTRSELIYATI